MVHTLIWTIKELEKEQSPKSVKGNNKNQRKLIDLKNNRKDKYNLELGKDKNQQTSSQTQEKGVDPNEK